MPPRTSARSPRTQRYAAQFDRPNLDAPARPHLAVLACMDARLTVEDVLGLHSGRRPHHPQRRRPRDRRRDPLAGDQPAPPRHRGGPRHRAHRLRDAHVRGRRTSTNSSTETTGEHVDLPLPRLPGPRGEPARAGRPDPGAPVDQGCSGARARSTRSRPVVSARSTDPGRIPETLNGVEPRLSRRGSTVAGEPSARHG